MVIMVKMDSRQRLLDHLKRRGASRLDELTAALSLSENAVRHHLHTLELQGFLKTTREHTGVGRPANVYSLTESAENLFPKQYQELLELVLAEIQELGVLQKVISGLTARMTAQLQDQKTSNLNMATPEARVNQLVKQLDFGGILSELETTNAGWELKAFNCRYRDTGFQYEMVCDILPQVIEQVTGLHSFRSVCQRDGSRACHFAIQHSG
jgi:predicted ArsR family transcriptional regulator